MKHNKKRKILCLVFIIPLMILALGGVVMFLWNMILPEVLGVQEVNFWQALGILILSKILFGGIHNRIGGKCSAGKSKMDIVEVLWMDIQRKRKKCLRKNLRRSFRISVTKNSIFSI